jgi:hypothetical protein
MGVSGVPTADLLELAHEWVSPEVVMTLADRGCPDSRFHALVEELHTTNGDLWLAEDEARSAEPARALEAVRRVQRLNARRNCAIEAIDAFLERAWHSDDDAVPHTETVGSVLDRVSVVTLRLHHTRHHSAADVGLTQRLPVLERQRADLLHALDELCIDLLDGRRRCPLPARFKLYAAVPDSFSSTR